MFCKRCNSLMQHTLRFENGKSLELNICPRCHYESKPIPIKYVNNQRKEIKNENTSRKRGNVK